MNSVYRKTKAEYDEMLEGEKQVRMARRDEWPEYTTYTAGYLLKENLPEDKKGEYVLQPLMFYYYYYFFLPSVSRIPRDLEKKLI